MSFQHSLPSSERPSLSRFSPQEKLDEARACTCASVCYQLLASVIVDGRPLDKSLAKLFRENKRFGSQDRRLISESVFSLCRWWGWVRVLVPSDDPAYWTALSRDRLIESPSWFLPLLAASLLDGASVEGAVFYWAKRNRLREVEPLNPRETLSMRAKQFAEIFGCDVPKAAALFPSWTGSVFPKEMSLESLYPWLQRRPPLWLRIQGKHDEVKAFFGYAGSAPDHFPGIRDVMKIENTRLNLFETDAFRNGWVEVQDISSQCVGSVCAPKPGQRWLDYCAGAGGKTLQLAALMNNKGTLVAVDKRNWKLDDLKRRARRAGFSNIQPRQSEGDFPKVPQTSFDGVLVDAPCSCTGTWRRNPDARWSSSPEDIMTLAALQKDILSHAVKAVKPGGVLVYATCSFTVTENEDVAAWFLETYPDFEADAFAHPLTGRQCPDGMLRVLPADGDGDGMFVARFKKKS